MPFCFNVKIKNSCQTLSKAWKISKKTPRTSWSPSKDWYISEAIAISWVMQESPGVNADLLAAINFSR